MDVRKRALLSIAAALALWIGSCTSATPAAEPDSGPAVVTQAGPALSPEGLPRSEAEVPRVSIGDTLAAIQSGEAVVVDVRSDQSYQASHIAGAISIPLGQIETNPAGLDLDKDRWIITYCT